MSTSPKPEVAVFKVQVSPRSSQNKVELQVDGSLKIWVSSPPVDGEANVAVCELLARLLRVSKSSVSIQSGRTGKKKVIRIASLNTLEALDRLNPDKTA